MISIDEQLKLLLTNLQGCNKLKMPAHPSDGKRVRGEHQAPKDKLARPG